MPTGAYTNSSTAFSTGAFSSDTVPLPHHTGRLRFAVPLSEHGSASSPTPRVDCAAPSRSPSTAPLHLPHHGSIALRRPALRARLRFISQALLSSESTVPGTMSVFEAALLMV